MSNQSPPSPNGDNQFSGKPVSPSPGGKTEPCIDANKSYGNSPKPKKGGSY